MAEKLGLKDIVAEIAAKTGKNEEIDFSKFDSEKLKTLIPFDDIYYDHAGFVGEGEDKQVQKHM